MSLFITIKRGMNRTKTIVIFLMLFLLAIFSFYFQAMLDFGNSVSTLRSAYENTMLISLELRFIMLIMTLIGPLIISFAFGDIYFDDLDSNCISLILTREEKRKYHRNNLLAVFIISFFIMLIPLLINLGLCMYTYPLTGFDNSTCTPAYVISKAPVNSLEYLRIYNPLRYNMIYIITPSIIFALFASVTYCISIVIKTNKYLCCLISYGIYIGFNLILEKLHMDKYKLFNYMNPLAPNMGLQGFIKDVIVIIIFILILYFIGVKREIDIN